MIKSFFDLSKKFPCEVHYDDKNSLDIVRYDNTLILDLFDTFASICYIDFYNKRNEDSYKTIEVEVEVVNIEIMKLIENKLSNLIRFMTNGENWEIKFKQTEKKHLDINMKQLGLFQSEFNSVALLSGGLDAMAGASQELNNNTLYVTYATNDPEVSKAKKTFDVIKKSSPNSEHVIVEKKQFAIKKHSTQRTRSLIFLGSALLYADYYKVPIIKIYENGIMSLNPTFEFRRKVTKTTHPRTLFYINDILKTVGINITVINPFCFMTKAEVIDLIPNEWIDLLKNSKTCSKMPGSKGFQNREKSGVCHCGICTACILRQISICSSLKNSLDCKYILPYNISSYDEIVKYEKLNGVQKSGKIVENISLYKFIEKKSLLQYYSEFKTRIDNGTIFSYLELSPKILSDKSDYESYIKMLSKFSDEIDNYISQQK